MPSATKKASKRLGEVESSSDESEQALEEELLEKLG